jgi:hypothetical protein
MTKGITRPFEIPKETRAVAEQSVEQAKLAFNSYLQAAQEAVSSGVFLITLPVLDRSTAQSTYRLGTSQRAR